MSLSIISYWGFGHIIYGIWAANAGQIWFTAGKPMFKIIHLTREQHRWLFWLAVATQLIFGSFLVYFAKNAVHAH